MKKSRIIRRRVVSKPKVIEFYTKEGGKPVWFKASQTVLMEELETKELISWLKRHKYRNLARALEKIVYLTQ